MKKKYWIMILAVVLAVALIVALAACGGLKTQPEVEEEEGVTPEDINGAADDAANVATKEDIDAAADAINGKDKSSSSSHSSSSSGNTNNSGNTGNTGDNKENEKEQENPEEQPEQPATNPSLLGAIMDIIDGSKNKDQDQLFEGIGNTVDIVVGGIGEIIGLNP